MDEQKKKKKITRLPPPGKDLASQYPEIAAEWDYELNGDLLPSQVFAHSARKVWWRCKNCGQSWAATIDHRTGGSGCPYDAGHLPIPGKTDLATLRPDLAEEWDYEKNGNITPDMVTASSHKKVWWKCKNCGMSWEAQISSRTHGTGCPYDARHLPIPGKTDLATLFPHIAAEWDYERNNDLTPEMFTIYSNKKVWWKCENCGQSWCAPIENRVYGWGCPYDAGLLPIPGKTDLATLYPDIAAEWDYDRNGDFLPNMATASSGKKVWWKCKNCGMSWEASISDRTRGYGCPYDAGRLPIPGKTDLATLRPDLVEEWDYKRNDNLTPQMVTVSSGKKVWWKCRNCGMSWPARINDRTSGHGCPYDARHLPIPGRTDLATLRPDLVEEWDYKRNGNLTPQMVTVSSHKKVWWKCRNCGMSWEASICDRTRGYGCPYDAGKLPIPGKTDLATLRPDLAEEWDYELNGSLTPAMITAHSHKKVWWKCRNCGMSWEASICGRTRGYGCPYDAGKLPIPGKTDLATLRPDLAEEWDYELNGSLIPAMITAHSDKKVWWKCIICGRSWKSSVASRSIGSRCRHNNRTRKSGANNRDEATE